MGRVVSYYRLKSELKKLDGRKILVGGCFDILHIGHLKFLKSAKKSGDRLIIALESDEFIEKNKNKKPFHSQEERAQILASLEFTDLIIKLPVFESDKDYFNLVSLLKPSIIAITEGDPQTKNKLMQAKEVGGRVLVVADFIKNKASSLVDKTNISTNT